MDHGEEQIIVNDTYDRIPGLNIYFDDDGSRVYRIFCWEYFHDPLSFMDTTTFHYAMKYEIDYFVPLSFVEFANTLFE